MSRNLIVLPDDTAKPILDAIKQPSKSLRIKMFVFSDPALIEAVIAAHNRGVKVRIMLNPTRRNGESENDESRRHAERLPVSRCCDSNPAFDLTHEKSMVVDDNDGLRQIAELAEQRTSPRPATTPSSPPTARSGRDRSSVSKPTGREEFACGSTSHLIWCVGNGRQRIAQFIDERQALAVAAERALPGSGHHRAPGSRQSARRKGSRDGAPAAQAEKGKAH